MNDSVTELPLKVDGQGDGVKKTTLSKRYPVQSSRRFNAKEPTNEIIRLKLKKAIMGMETSTPRKIIRHNCIEKANTIAEITPSKMSAKKKSGTEMKTPNRDDNYNDITLYATPRPFENETRFVRCPRQKAVCLLYQRLLLRAWRGCKSRLTDLNELYNQQHNNVAQLEIQIEVLNTLRKSESDRRHAALNDCQTLRLKINELETGNKTLNEIVSSTNEALDETRTHLILTKEDLQNCSGQLKKVQGQLKKKLEEKMDLLYKLTEQDRQIQCKNLEIKNLREDLKTMEMNLQNSDSNYKTKSDEVNELFDQLQNEINKNESLMEENKFLKQQQDEYQTHSRFLENELNTYTTSWDQLTTQNISIRNELLSVTMELDEHKKKWFETVYGPILNNISIENLKRAGQAIIPAILDLGLYL